MDIVECHEPSEELIAISLHTTNYNTNHLQCH
jgi:hypothetical protein